jgi:hypothetical protein
MCVLSSRQVRDCQAEAGPAQFGSQIAEPQRVEPVVAPGPAQIHKAARGPCAPLLRSDDAAALASPLLCRE